MAVPSVVTPIQDTGDALWASFTETLNRFMAFLPALVGAIIILVIGWIFSSVLGRLIERGLNAMGLQRAVERAGVENFMRRAGSSWTTSRLFGELTKWFVRLIFIQAAANILAMPQLTTIINSIILFIPNVIVAVAVIVIGSLIARFLSGAARASAAEMNFSSPERVASATYIAIMTFAVLAALNQLHIAPIIVNSLLIGLVGAVALALGLAFGLGGRDVAADVTKKWYEQGQDKYQKVNGSSQLSQPLGADSNTRH